MDMKQILPALIALWGCLILLPVAMAGIGQPGVEENQEYVETGQEQTAPFQDDAVTIQVYETQSHLVKQMTLREYLVGVVAAEMPASFEVEALKAQAVAARSDALSRMQKNTQDEKIYETHQGADVCTSPGHCAAWMDEGARRQLYGDSFETYEAKIRSVVEETDGQIAVYDEQPIVAVFHSTSSGRTESAQDVWGSDVPYLQSVDSPGEEASPRYESQVFVTAEKFVSQLAVACPGITVPDSTQQWVGDVVRSEAGGVESIVLCGQSFTGTRVREMFGLRSTHFTVTVQEDGLTFDVLGYGHGVGLSQYGANYMAQQGSSWEDIITWYYTGVSIGSIADIWTEDV